MLTYQRTDTLKRLVLVILTMQAVWMIKIQLMVIFL